MAAGQQYKIKRMTSNEEIKKKAQKISLLLTDIDGVLTDNGVYYGAGGEELKRFSVRDGMGVERLNKLCQVETGFVTGETSPSVMKRAEKLNIKELHLGIKNKLQIVNQIIESRRIAPEEIAFIGDDVNDLEAMARVGLCASPANAMHMVKQQVHYVCNEKGGEGCFREFAELIINCKTEKQ